MYIYEKNDTMHIYLHLYTYIYKHLNHIQMIKNIIVMKYLNEDKALQFLDKILTVKTR